MLQKMDEVQKHVPSTGGMASCKRGIAGEHHTPASDSPVPHPSVSEEEPPITFEKKCARLDEALVRQSLHRELLYKTLVFCQTRRTLREVEQAISSFSEFSQATQSPYHLMTVLVDAEGLDRGFLDVEGNLLDPEQLELLTEDEQDDLIADEVYETSEIGRKAVSRHAPHARLAELMGGEPQRETVYRELLSFCAEEPRTYRAISSLLENRSVLYRTVQGHRQLIQPSVLVDKLQRAAGLVWQNGWMTTEEGKEFLAGSGRE